MATSRWLPPALWLAAIALALVYLVSSLDVVSDISQFMPRSIGDEQRLSLVMKELEHGKTGRILFMRLRSPAGETTAGLSKQLRQRLLESRLFETVDNGQFDIDFDDFQQLFKYRYLINTRLDPDDFSEAGIHKELGDRITELRGGMGILLKHTLASDPINGFIDYLQTARFAAEPPSNFGVWFSTDSQWALLVASINQEGFNIDKQEEAIAYIRDTFYSLPGAGDASLQISGPGAFAVKARHNIQKTLEILSVCAALLIVALLYLAFRSISLVLMTGLPILSGMLFSVAIVNMVYGYVHGITLAFGITLLGICIDYPVHLFSHLRKDRSVASTLNQIMPVMLLGLVTTGLGYIVLIFSGFEGLQQLAVFAVAGLASALAVTRGVLPSLLNLSMVTESRRFQRFDGFYGRAGFRYPLLVLAVLAAWPLVWAALTGESVWQKDISALSPVPAQERQLDREIRQELMAAEVNHVFILVNTDVQRVLEETERLASALEVLVEDRLVGQVLASTNLLPSAKRQRYNQRILPRREQLEAIIVRTVAATPFKQEIFAQFIEDVDQQREMQPLTPEAMYETPVGRLLGADLFQSDGSWVSVIRLSGVSDEEALGVWLRDNPELAQDYLNLRHQTSELLVSYATNVVRWLVAGLLVMLVVLAVHARSVAKAARVMLAPVLAVLVSIGSIVWFYGEVNLFHLVSVLLIIGLGIDYSLFINKRSFDTADTYNNRHGVVVSAGSTLLAFGVLVFSEVPVLVAIGQTVAVGVIAAFLLALSLADRENAQSIHSTN